MKVMLDTNICIYMIKQKPQSVLERFRAFQVGDVGISSITLAELQYGAMKSARPRQNRESLKEFIAPLDVALFDIAASEAYGEIRASLEKIRPSHWCHGFADSGPCAEPGRSAGDQQRTGIQTSTWIAR